MGEDPATQPPQGSVIQNLHQGIVNHVSPENDIPPSEVQPLLNNGDGEESNSH